MTDKSTQLSSLLDAIQIGLGVIERVGSIPGASVIPYVSTLTSAADLAGEVIALGRDASKNIHAIKDTFSKPDVAPEDMAALDASIAQWRAALHAPLPPKEDGEPD